MDFYKLFLLFIMMILASAQDNLGFPTLAAMVATTETSVDSSGSNLFSMVKTVSSISSMPTGVAFVGLELAKSTVYLTSIVYVSDTTLFATTVLDPSTSTAIITVNLTSTAATSTIVSTTISTTTAVSTATANTTISTISSSLTTSPYYLSTQNTLTPYTAGVLATSTSLSLSTVFSSSSSPALRNKPHNLFKFAASFRRPAAGTNDNRKRETSCGGWNTTIIITAVLIAISLMSILLSATLFREKKEKWVQLYSYRWWIYSAQIVLVLGLVFLISWSAVKTTGNGCN